MPIRIGKRGHFMNVNIDNFPKTYRGFYWLVMKKFPWYFGISALVGILMHASNIWLEPYVTKWQLSFFEYALNNPGWHYVYKMFDLIVGYAVFMFSLDFIKRYMDAKIRPAIFRYRTSVLFYRIYANDMPFFIDRNSGSIISDARTVYERLMSLTVEFWPELIGNIVGFILLLISLFVINWHFLAVLCGYAVVRALWQWKTQKSITKNSVNLNKRGSDYNGKRNDSISHALLVKLFANTEYETKWNYDKYTPVKALSVKNGMLNIRRDFPMMALLTIVRIVFLVMCFIYIKNGILGIPDAVFIMHSTGRLNNALSRVNTKLMWYYDGVAIVKKAYERIIVERKITDKPKAKLLKTTNAEILLENIDFAYGTKKILNKLNLTIKPKEKVGIVGLSGAGKTTLCNLLLRMYDVQGGAVKINGLDVRDLKHESLLRNIAYVPQDTQIFNRSILENIKYAKPHASKSQIIKATKQAHIHEFISKLPDGYDTKVGDNGFKLSGGQRQRVSIARALLKDAPILILDEATSAMDSQNELAIQKSLQVAMHNKTALVIAHRLSTLRNMDKIIVLKHGQIVEVGSHKQLIRKKDGVYKKLWSMQTGGFIK